MSVRLSGARERTAVCAQRASALWKTQRSYRQRRRRGSSARRQQGWLNAQSKNFREQCTAWRVPSRSQRGPVVRQLGNGRAVSGVGRLIRQRLRSTRAHARASTRAHAPKVHTPAHISMILHKHDTSTFLHLQADMLTSQRRERARRMSQGMARRDAAENPTMRAATGHTTTST